MRKVEFFVPVGAMLLAFTASPALAQDEAARARERADKWARTLYRPDPVDRLLASWDLVALAPHSQEPLVALLDGGKFGNASLLSADQTVGELGAASALRSLVATARNTRLAGDVRISALIAIAKIGGDKGKEALASFVTDENDADATSELLRCAALVAQGMRGDALPIPVIERALASEDPELRRAAYRAIGFSRDRRFVPHCTKGLQDAHPLVLAEAARSLGKLNDAPSGDKIDAILKKNRNVAVRFLLIEALAWMGKKPAIDELLADLEDPDSRLQASAAGILIEIGERRAIPVFRGILQSVFEKGRRCEPGADVRAAYALGFLGDKESGAVLAKALEKGTIELRREAAAALGAIRAKEGVPALRAASRGQDRILRMTALVALGDIREPSTGDDLVAALDDHDPFIRYAASVALAQLGNRRAVPALKGVLEDQHDFVAIAAKEAISKLEERPIAAADSRDQAVLTRLRALEREYSLRIQLGRLFQSYSSFLAQNAAAKPDTYEIIGWETTVDSCGGAHPSPIYGRKIVDRSKERARDAQRAGAVELFDQQRLEESYALQKFRRDAEAELHGDGKTAK